MFKKILSLFLCLLMLSTVAFAAPSSWAVTEINTAKSNGLVPDSLLSDYQNFITREEFCSMAVLLYKALSGKETPESASVFEDTQSTDVAAAYSLGIVKGVSDTHFAPQSLITRQEIATMFLRCASAAIPSVSASYAYVNTFPDESNISDWAKDAVKFANLCEVMLGDENKYINPKNNTTREQAIAMVLRTYDALRPRDNSIMSSYGFLSSGNTSSNMANGAFAVVSIDSSLYISDATGIFKASDKKYITNNTASAIFPDTDKLYYINSADSALYSVSYSGSNETKLYEKAVSFSISSEYIYINDGKNLVMLNTKDNSKTVLAENVISAPIPSVRTVMTATSDGIFSIDIKTLEKTAIYSGAVKAVVSKSNDIFFINGDGMVCKTDTDGKTAKVISDKIATSLCEYNGGIAYTTNDGIYKCDKNGKFNIKLANDVNCSLNSYERTLYFKTSDGKIYSFNPLTAEKTPIN